MLSGTVACGTAAERTTQDSVPAATNGVTTATTVGSTVRAGPSASAAVPRGEIWFDSVFVGNPLLVFGHARTFENTVQVRVRDSRGVVLTEIYETSVGEMGHHNPFSARVWLVRDPGPSITLESFEYSAKDGSVRSLTSLPIDVPGRRTAATVHFSTSECSATRPFRREVPFAVAVAGLLVEILVAGPTAEERAKGASHPFPPGSRVRSVILRDSVLTVDFDERLRNVGGACRAEAIRTAVTRTLAQLPGVKSVVITAGGSRELALQP